MGRFAKLAFTSNPKLKQYIGCVGDLEKNEKGGYNFRMRETGSTIRTTGALFGTVLGEISTPFCRSLSFQTMSGTTYQFEFLEIERVVDGTRMVGNRFVGFENDALARKIDTAKEEASSHNVKLESLGHDSCFSFDKWFLG